MIRGVSLCGLIVAIAVSYSGPLFGQSPSPTTLVIELQNVVEYQGDVGDPQRFATNPNITVGMTPRNFGAATVLGDVVAVNGQPAKGTYVGKSFGIQASPAPTGGAPSLILPARRSGPMYLKY